MNLEQALKILGGDFAKCRVNRSRAFSDREDGGLSVCFHYTKMYGSNVWWTSETFLAVDSCNYLIIALQNRGLLVLPRKVLIGYWTDLKVSTLKSGRRNIRIKEEYGKIYLYNCSNQRPIDVTEHLHPCEVSDSQPF